MYDRLCIFGRVVILRCFLWLRKVRPDCLGATHVCACIFFIRAFIHLYTGIIEHGVYIDLFVTCRGRMFIQLLVCMMHILASTKEDYPSMHTYIYDMMCRVGENERSKSIVLRKKYLWKPCNCPCINWATAHQFPRDVARQDGEDRHTRWSFCSVKIPWPPTGDSDSDSDSDRYFGHAVSESTSGV